MQSSEHGSHHCRWATTYKCQSHWLEQRWNMPSVCFDSRRPKDTKSVRTVEEKCMFEHAIRPFRECQGRHSNSLVAHAQARLHARLAYSIMPGSASMLKRLLRACLGHSTLKIAFELTFKDALKFGYGDILKLRAALLCSRMRAARWLPMLN